MSLGLFFVPIYSSWFLCNRGHKEINNMLNELLLGLCPVIFWTELRCWCKSYSKKVTLFLCRILRYKISTVVIKNLLAVTKYPFLNWQWSFSILCGFPSINDKNFTVLNYHQHDAWLIRNRNCLPFVSIWVIPWFFVGSICSFV